MSTIRCMRFVDISALHKSKSRVNSDTSDSYK